MTRHSMFRIFFSITVFAFGIAVLNYAYGPSRANAADAGTLHFVAEKKKQPFSKQKRVRRSYPPALIAKARQHRDEFEDCMNNPESGETDFIELLGGCFCLSINNESPGC